MDIEILPFIATYTYNDPNVHSVSFIIDIKNGVHFLIYGNISILWNFIIKSRNYNEIIDFAEKNGVKYLLNDFLGELKAYNIINADFIKPIHVKKYLKYAIDEKSDNFDIFTGYKKNLICEKLHSLATIRLSLNYTCNLNCKHCCNPKNIFDEMKFNQAKSIIDEAISMGVNSVSLSGGECTINKDFLKIAQYVRSKYLELSILTNAQKLYDDKSMFNSLINIYPSEVQISLYSMNSKIHDSITGHVGSHYKTVEVIKELKKNNIHVIISCVQFAFNKNSYIEVKKFADSINCGFITDCKFIYNPDNDNFNAKLSAEDIENFYLNMIDVNKPRIKNNIVCSGGIDRFEIMPNLDIIPCTYFYYPLGNYKNISLTDVQKTSLKEFHKIFKDKAIKDCFKYEYCKYCTYCPKYFKGYEKNGFIKNNDILCEDARAYQKAYIKKLKIAQRSS